MTQQRFSESIRANRSSFDTSKDANFDDQNSISNTFTFKYKWSIYIFKNADVRAFYTFHALTKLRVCEFS